MEAFADDKFNVALFNRIEIIVGKGENAGYQHFLLFPQCFQRASSSGRKKSGMCGKELMNLRKIHHGKKSRCR